MKKDKNKPPATIFGEILKNAISQPISKKESENQGKDDTQNSAKTSPPLVINQVKTPSSHDFSSKSNSTNTISKKENDSNQRQPINQIPAPKSSVSFPNSSSTSKSNNFIKPPESSIRIEDNKKQISIAEVNAAKNKSSDLSNDSQKYLSFMRKKFWDNLDGEVPSGHRGRSLRINLGVDLGTSFSKVVYRLYGESYPVLFGLNKNKIEDYLIPSVVVVNKTGIKCKFEFEDEEKLKKVAQIPNFKICLTCEHGDKTKDCVITKCNLSNFKSGYLPDEVIGEEASFLTSFYLAKLIARAKQSVRRQLPEREIPSDITIKWSANLAVPDKFLDSEVADGFREALEIGWLMSEIFLAQPKFSNKHESSICYLAAKELQTEIKMELLLQGKDFDCFTYSEIGAEVASVTLSPTSEEGLYVLVDVGAGTVDTSVFRFRRVDGENMQETYAANIFKLGAAQIDARANASFMRKSLNWLRQIKENVFQRNSEKAMIHVTEELKSAEDSVVVELREKLISVYREAFNKQKNVEVWSGLKLVMGGGGSAIKSYGETAREAFSPKIKDARLIEFSSLKVPKDFQMETLPASQFHRFAVAYGLSRDRIELPELISASQILPMNSLRQRSYIDPTNDG